MQARHHAYYAGREPSWYAPITRQFRGVDAVLDLGCGPGLSLQALTEVGVRHARGLERDPVFVARAQASGLDVVAHDLNDPFVFIPSGSQDAVIAHHVIDYLAPAALQQTFNEVRRVLRQGGRFVAYSSTQGWGAATPCGHSRIRPAFSAPWRSAPG